MRAAGARNRRRRWRPRSTARANSVDSTMPWSQARPAVSAAARLIHESCVLQRAVPHRRFVQHERDRSLAVRPGRMGRFAHDHGGGRRRDALQIDHRVSRHRGTGLPRRRQHAARDRTDAGHLGSRPAEPGIPARRQRARRCARLDRRPVLLRGTGHEPELRQLRADLHPERRLGRQRQHARCSARRPGTSATRSASPAACATRTRPSASIPTSS